MGGPHCVSGHLTSLGSWPLEPGGLADLEEAITPNPWLLGLLLCYWAECPLCRGSGGSGQPGVQPQGTLAEPQQPCDPHRASPSHPKREGGSLVVPILQRRKLRLKEAKQLV